MNPADPRRLAVVLPRAAARAAQWRPLLLMVLAGWIPTALLAVPLWRLMAENLDASVPAAQWAQHLDVAMFADFLARIKPAGGALAGAGLSAALALLLLMPFQHAVLVTCARTDQRLGLGELLHAGLREYGPMLRMLFVSLIPLGLALGAAALAFKGLGRFARHAIVEADVDHLAWTIDAVAAVLLVFALASIEAGRARFAVDPRRRSALRAWWRGFKLVLLDPLRGLGVFLGIAVPALIVVLVLAVVRAEIATASAAGFAAGWLIVQALAAVMSWAHLARLSAYFELTRAADEAAGALRPRSV